MSNNRKKTIPTDEVERLLEAAQDEIMLNLSVDSHISNSALDYLHPDLHRRFHSLKGRTSVPRQQPPPPLPNHNQKQPPQKQLVQSPVIVDDELKVVLGDDLSARFASLKASLPSSSSTSDHARIDLRKNDDTDTDEEDEVEKVIRWAKDAARLDPSPSSDDSDAESSSDDDDDKEDRRK